MGWVDGLSEVRSTLDTKLYDAVHIAKDRNRWDGNLL